MSKTTEKRMPFGKHKGALLSEIELDTPDYIDWLSKLDNLYPDLRAAVCALRSARPAPVPPAPVAPPPSGEDIPF
jgi:hypothetical protein